MTAMNVIWIVCDTLRYDHIGANGNRWIKTPGLDAFAAKALCFDRAFALSLPTIPNRTDLFTGRYTFPRRGWTPLQDTDVTAAQRFGDLGMRTQMIIDTYHLKRDGYNFDRGFHGWEWIRGQEGDRLLPPLDSERIRVHPTREDIRLSPLSVEIRELSNAMHRRFESDYISPRTYTAAEHWLEYHHDREPFFLYIDSFDPHEPWDPPAYYVSLYDESYGGEVLVYPRSYSYIDDIPEELIAKVRCQYAGKVTMVDRWLGRLLQKIEDLRLLGNTLVVVTSDHGFLFGEHGRLGKRNRDGKRLLEETGDRRYAHPWPIFRPIQQIVLMIHTPEMKGGSRSDAIVQPVDVLPTTLDWLGVEIDGAIEGRSFLGLLSGDTDRGRDVAVTSFELMPHRESFNAVSTVTDGRWQLHFTTRAGETELYDLQSDPGEEVNLFADRRDIARELHQRFYEIIRDKVDDPVKAELVRRLPD